MLLVLLSTAIIINVVRMFNQWRTRQAGSRFTLRLMQGFLVLTLLPVLFVSLFAIQLIGPRIDRWFEVSIERALEDSLELSQLALETRNRQYLATLSASNPRCKARSCMKFPPCWKTYSASMPAKSCCWMIPSKCWRLALEDTETLIPQMPDRNLFRALQMRNYYYALEPEGDDKLFSRVAVNVRYGSNNEFERHLDRTLSGCRKRKDTGRKRPKSA